MSPGQARMVAGALRDPARWIPARPPRRQAARDPRLAPHRTHTFPPSRTTA